MRKRIASTILAVLLLGSVAHADDSSQRLFLLTPTRQQAYDKAEDYKRHGAAWMILGALHLAAGMGAGIYMMVSSEQCKRSEGCMNGDFVTPIAVGLTTGLGTIFTTVGIPLYVAGSKRAAALLQPQATGFALRF